MTVLGKDMKSEVSLHPVQHNKTMLVWEAIKPDHTEEVPMAYTTKVDKMGKS